jgi:hypothetical protein
MRALSIVCGIAVIVMTLHLGHGIHHFYSHAGHQGMHGIALYGAMAAAALMGVLSLVGGFLLLKGNR